MFNVFCFWIRLTWVFVLWYWCLVCNVYLVKVSTSVRVCFGACCLALYCCDLVFLTCVYNYVLF